MDNVFGLVFNEEIWILAGALAASMSEVELLAKYLVQTSFRLFGHSVQVSTWVHGTSIQTLKS